MAIVGASVACFFSVDGIVGSGRKRVLEKVFEYWRSHAVTLCIG